MEFLGLPGIEQMRTFLDGYGPRPPISHLTGMEPVEIGPGQATFVMPASEWLLAPQGLISGGTLAVLADGPLGSAIQTSLPAATPYTTAELSMSFLRPATPQSGTLNARGRLIHMGRSLALSEVFVEDSRGRLLAHGTSRCYVFPPIDPPPPPPKLERVPVIDYPTPDPYLRPPPGEVVDQTIWNERSGLDVMRGFVSRELPPPPMHWLTGLMPVEAEEGSCSFVLPATGWSCSPLARVEGGMIAMLADAAIASTIQTTLPAGTAFASVDLKVTFVRPVEPDGRELLARGSMINRGRTLATARAEVVNADGKQVANAVGSAMILPGRTASLDRPVAPAEEALPDSE